MGAHESGWAATPEVREAILRAGRTEDIRFSPDGRLLAIAAYLEDAIFLVEVELPRGSGDETVRIRGCRTLTSDSLAGPHGLMFPGNDHLLVCNREGDVVLFRIPEPGISMHHAVPVARKRGKGSVFTRVATPGSADGHPIDDHSYRVLICNNHWDFISSHVVSFADPARPSIANDGKLIERKLKLPDGIAVSPDRAWIAVSNHVTGEAYLYPNSPDTSPRTPPSAVLTGLVCPHGLRFVPDGSWLLVADAASPYLMQYQRPPEGWSGTRAPTKCLRVMSDEIFFDGRYDVREGGWKGIDIDPSGRFLVSTHAHDVLRFDPLDRVLASADEPVADYDVLCRERDRLFASKADRRRRWQWSDRVRDRLRASERIGRRFVKQARDGLKLARHRVRNECSREAIVDADGPPVVVSMTTHAKRLESTYLAIESIGAGRTRPRRFLLWLPKQLCDRPLPAALVRLQARGLEIFHVDDLGPHTKYMPYCESLETFEHKLVTADDDVFHPVWWLSELVQRADEQPDHVHCFRAHRIGLTRGCFSPYNQWEKCRSVEPSHLNLITGVSGVIYPPALLRTLKARGRRFLACCPNGDDIWLTKCAIDAGIEVAQVRPSPLHFRHVPGTQAHRLSDLNVIAGRNQIQLRRTFEPDDLRRLERLVAAENE